MKHSNLPIPQGPRAPINPKWFLTRGIPAGIIWTYRNIFPARFRAGWNNGVSTSHEAMAAVLAPDGGWKTFAHYTTPRLATKRQYGFMFAWMLFIVSIVMPRLRIDKGQSWAN